MLFYINFSVIQSQEKTKVIFFYSFEVIKIHYEKIDAMDKVKIYGVKISQDDSGCFTFSVQHTGSFNLKNYQKLELEVKSAKLVRKT